MHGNMKDLFWKFSPFLVEKCIPVIYLGPYYVSPGTAQDKWLNIYKHVGYIYAGAQWSWCFTVLILYLYP